MEPKTPKTPKAKLPAFCSRCGQPLAEHESTFPQGFDPYTGKELPDGKHVTRRCVAPMHDVWVLTQGEWGKAS